MRRHFRSALIILIAWIVARSLIVLPFTAPFVKMLDLGIYDTVLKIDRFLKTKINQPIYDSIVIVDIDDKSLSQLGQFSQWPNQYFADATNVLNMDAPKLIAYDVMFADSSNFTRQSRDRITNSITDSRMRGYSEHFFEMINGDDEFAQAIFDAGNVFLAMFNNPNLDILPPLPPSITPWDVSPRYALEASHPHPPIPVLADVAYGVGFAQVSVDESSKIHDFPLFIRFGKEYFVNFSFQACLDLLAVDSIKVDRSKCRLYSKHKQVRILPLSPNGKFYLKYPHQSPAFRTVSFVDLINQRVSPGYFYDKIVLIGSSATGLGDTKSVPFSSELPGVELHATLIRNILENEFVTWNYQIWDFFWLALLLGVLMLLIKTGKPLIQLGWILGASLLLFIYFIWLYNARGSTMYYSRLVLPWLICGVTLVFDHYNRQVRERKMVHDAFGHFVSKDVIAEVMKDKDALKIGGKRRYVSALITDIRGFSTYCEKCEVDEITSFINQFFNRATNLIIEQKGLLDKFMGDAILALFNVPYATPDYAIHACRTALLIQAAAQEQQQEYREHPILHSFKIGVGISSGEVIVGNIGSDTIFNYTGIGTSMNMCSRLEALNKVYETLIIVDESTYRMANDHFCFRHLDYTSVKGIKHPVHIYELVGEVQDTDSQYSEFMEIYGEGVDLMAEKRFEEAKSSFQKAATMRPEDFATQMMIERLDIMNWETWNGVWEQKHK